MKLIIAGSRTIQVEPFEIHHLVNHFQLDPITEIVSGTAKGVDQCGEAYAKDCRIPVKRFPADWDKFGKSAGFRRNKEMAEYADVLLLIWDGESRGSSMMKTIMEDLGKPVFAVVPRKVGMSPALAAPYSAGNQTNSQDPYKEIAEKVEYVKSQGQTRAHHCHWPDCDAQVPPAMWGCRKHWYKLPKRLRDRIWATYRPGQERNMTPSEAYMKVALEVQEWIKANG